MWDTSGSTNFDSVRPLSYSEVVWEASCSAHTDLVHFHRLLPEMPTDNISISRRIFSLFASALLSPSPSTMSEVTGQLRWKTMLENRIVKKLFYNLRWENILLHHSSCVDVSLTWGKEIPVWPEKFVWVNNYLFKSNLRSQTNLSFLSAAMFWRFLMLESDQHFLTSFSK